MARRVHSPAGAVYPGGRPPRSSAVSRTVVSCSRSGGSTSAECRLGDGGPAGGGEEPAGFRDGDESDEVATPFEHSVGFRFQITERVSSRSRSRRAERSARLCFRMDR